MPNLVAVDPVLPEDLRGRTADNWRPLVAIADVAGGDWPVKARQAAEMLSAGRNEQSAGVMLLDDIRGLFSNRNTDRLTSAEIVDSLGKREDRPWSEWRGDKPITARQLARLLEPFGVHPTTIRTHTGTAKGYHHDDFADAFLRYPGAASVTPSQARESAALRQSASVTVVDECYGSDVPATAENGGCDGVTDEPGDKRGSTSDEDLQVAFQERAAILEHDGGLSRHEAEQRAAAEIGWEALLGRGLQVLAGEHAAIIEIDASLPDHPLNTQAVEDLLALPSASIREASRRSRRWVSGRPSRSSTHCASRRGPGHRSRVSKAMPVTAESLKCVGQTREWLSWLDPLDAEIVRLRCSGSSWKPICWQLGISRATAHRRWKASLQRIAHRLPE